MAATPSNHQRVLPPPLPLSPPLLPQPPSCPDIAAFARALDLPLRRVSRQDGPLLHAATSRGCRCFLIPPSHVLVCDPSELFFHPPPPHWLPLSFPARPLRPLRPTLAPMPPVPIPVPSPHATLPFSSHIHHPLPRSLNSSTHSPLHTLPPSHPALSASTPSKSPPHQPLSTPATNTIHSTPPHTNTNHPTQPKSTRKPTTPSALPKSVTPADTHPSRLKSIAGAISHPSKLNSHENSPSPQHPASGLHPSPHGVASTSLKSSSPQNISSSVKSIAPQNSSLPTPATSQITQSADNTTLHPPSSTPLATHRDQQKDSNHSAVAGAVGGVFAGIVGLALLLVACILISRSRRAQRANFSSPPLSSPRPSSPLSGGHSSPNMTPADPSTRYSTGGLGLLNRLVASSNGITGLSTRSNPTALPDGHSSPTLTPADPSTRYSTGGLGLLHRLVASSNGITGLSTRSNPRALPGGHSSPTLSPADPSTRDSTGGLGLLDRLVVKSDEFGGLSTRSNSPASVHSFVTGHKTPEMSQRLSWVHPVSTDANPFSDPTVSPATLHLLAFLGLPKSTDDKTEVLLVPSTIGSSPDPARQNPLQDGPSTRHTRNSSGSYYSGLSSELEQSIQFTSHGTSSNGKPDQMQDRV